MNMDPATNKKHYYVRSRNSKWVEAPDDVKNALNNPCAFEHPPPNSKCTSGAYNEAQIQFKNAMIDTADNDFTANVITRNTILLGTDDSVDVEGYNENWDEKQRKMAENRLIELAGNRMNEEGGPHMVLRHNIPNKTANKDLEYLSYLANRQADGLGGAKNKKKQRFRTKRRRSASRRKAPRRRNAPRRRTGKK